jgi:hypothetical protein
MAQPRVSVKRFTKGHFLLQNILNMASSPLAGGLTTTGQYWPREFLVTCFQSFEQSFEHNFLYQLDTSEDAFYGLYKILPWCYCGFSPADP